MAGDIISDYSSLVGLNFTTDGSGSYHVGDGKWTDNGDGTFSVTISENIGYEITGVVDANGNPDQLQLSSNGTNPSTVLGHNAHAVMVEYPGYPSYALVFSDQPVNVGDTFTYSLTDPNAPMGTVICFAEGTPISTEAGDVAVEALSVGDMVLTASGELRPIKWIGQMVSRPSRHPRPWEVNPVCVKADAFGKGVPSRDVRLSPGHAVYVEGVLIPVGKLINGATIVQEETDAIRYFHVELEAHDVLLAAGLPCESYLDDGNRATFSNAGEAIEMFGRLDPKSWDDACAPMVAAGPQLEEVQRRLIARAEELGWTKVEEANLHLIADGAVIEPMRVSGERAWFLVPACTELTLASSASVLRQIMPELQDARRLGVAVSEVKVDGVPLDLTDRTHFRTGFYGLERHEDTCWRWTNGGGRLVLELSEPSVIEVRTHITAPSWKRAVGSLRLSKVA